MSEENQLNGYDLIQNVLSPQLTLQELAVKLVPGAVAISGVRIGEKSNSECQTFYNEKSVDTFIWALGVMCQEWVFENFYRKCVGGHCNKHSQPCEKGREFHKSLLEECLKSFEGTLKKNNDLHCD